MGIHVENVEYSLLSEVMVQQEHGFDTGYQTRLEAIEKEADECNDLVIESEELLGELATFDFVYDNADAILEASKENEVILEAISFAIQHDNVTEGFVDGVKKGFKVVWDFLKKIFQSVKKLVLKVVDFIFGTTYGADYEDKLTKATKQIEAIDEKIASKTGKERVLALFDSIKTKFKGDDKKAEEIAKQLGDKPDAIAIINAMKTGDELTAEQVLILQGIEPVIADGEEKTTVQRLKESYAKFKTHPAKTKASELIDKLYTNVIKEAGTSLAAKMDMPLVKLDQKEKRKLLTDYNDVFEPLTGKQRVSMVGAFVKTVVIGPGGADFTILHQGKQGIQTTSFKRPINKSTDPKKLSFAMQTLYKKMGVKNVGNVDGNTLNHLKKLGASKKEIKKANKWLDTLDVSSIEDIITTYIEDNNLDDGNKENFKELLDFYRRDKTTMLKAIKEYSSTKAKQAKGANVALNVMSADIEKALSENAEAMLKVITDSGGSLNKAFANGVKVVKGKSTLSFGKYEVFEIKTKDAFIKSNDIILTISANNGLKHYNMWSDENNVLYKTKGDVIVPITKGDMVMTTKGPVKKGKVATKQYQTEKISTKLIKAKSSYGTSHNARYEFDGNTSDIMHMVGIIGRGATKLTPYIAIKS